MHKTRQSINTLNGNIYQYQRPHAPDQANQQKFRGNQVPIPDYAGIVQGVNKMAIRDNSPMKEPMLSNHMIANERPRAPDIQPSEKHNSWRDPASMGSHGPLLATDISVGPPKQHSIWRDQGLGVSVVPPSACKLTEKIETIYPRASMYKTLPPIEGPEPFVWRFNADKLMLYFGISSSIAKSLGLVDGSTYYPPEQLYPWVCDALINADFPIKVENHRLLSDLKAHMFSALVKAKDRLRQLQNNQRPEVAAHAQRYYHIYNITCMDSQTVKFCNCGKVKECGCDENVV